MDGEGGKPARMFWCKIFRWEKLRERERRGVAVQRVRKLVLTVLQERRWWKNWNSETLFTSPSTYAQFSLDFSAVEIPWYQQRKFFISENFPLSKSTTAESQLISKFWTANKCKKIVTKSIRAEKINWKMIKVAWRTVKCQLECR